MSGRPRPAAGQGAVDIKMQIEFDSKTFQRLIHHKRLQSLSPALKAELVVRSSDNFPAVPMTAEMGPSQLIQQYVDMFRPSSSVPSPPVEGGAATSGAEAAASGGANDRAASPAVTVQRKVEVVVPELTVEQSCRLAFDAFRRILSADAEGAAKRAGPAAVSLRASLISKLAAVALPCAQTDALVTEYLMEDFVGRYEYAVRWLYALAVTDSSPSSSSSQDTKDGATRPSPRYYKAVKSLLKRFETKVATDSVFARLVLDLPVVTDAVFEAAEEYTKSNLRRPAGIGALCDMALHRSTNRLRAVRTLLALACDSNAALRKSAIEAVTGKAMTVPELGAEILKFARDKVSEAVARARAVKSEDDDGDAAEGKDDVEIPRRLELEMDICAKHPQEVAQLFTLAAGAPETVCKAVTDRMSTLAKGIGVDSTPLLNIIALPPPPGAETMLGSLITELAALGVTIRLVMAVRTLYQRSRNVSYLVPVINGLNKRDALEALPALVELDDAKAARGAVRNLIAPPAGAGVPVTPAEVLVTLIDLSSNKSTKKVSLKKLKYMIIFCIRENRAVYSRGVLSAALKQLVERTPVPRLFMLTVIYTLQLYPEAAGFAVEILGRLVSARVWEDDQLWQGFIICAEKTQPGSLQVLLGLPAEQLARVLEAKPVLRPRLVEFANVNNTPVRQQIVDLLGISK